MQLICANYAMSTDIFPLEDRYDRQTFIQEVQEQRAAELVQVTHLDDDLETAFLHAAHTMTQNSEKKCRKGEYVVHVVSME